MKGLLIYDKEGAERNRWFIEKLCTDLLDLGLENTLAILAKGEKIVGDLPDFAIVRKIDPDLNSDLENRGVPVFNGARTAEIACDKWKTFLFCKENNIPVMSTKLLDEEPPFDYPFVVKSRDGHGGSEVFLIEDVDAWEEKKPMLDSRFIAQPLCDETGKDMRVYSLGGGILAAMLRTSQKDFRSNFSLGGSAEKVEPTTAQKEIVKKVHALLGFDFVGIDFIRHGGEWILNEIEDSVGTRMLYKHTDIDAVKAYALHIKNSLDKR